MNLNIFHIAKVKEKLGFGNRLVIWMSGCPFKCVGCIEERLRDGKIGCAMSVEDIFELITPHLKTIDGITFSGGEPLFQPEALKSLLQLIPDELNKMLFSGYNVSELSNIQKECFSLFDLAIMGRFNFYERGNYLWRGSKNKVILSPKATYSFNDLDKLYSSPSAGIEVYLSSDTVYFYGIPTESDEISKIMNSLVKNDIEIHTF